MTAKRQPVKTEPLFDITQKISIRLYNGENHEEIMDMSHNIIMDSNKLFLVNTSTFQSQHIRKGYYISYPNSIFQSAIIHPAIVEKHYKDMEVEEPKIINRKALKRKKK
jgi:hypothetical protein